MGKTKRRKNFGYGKNKRNYPSWVTLDYKNKTIADYGTNNPQLEGKDREKALKMFHSDSGFGDKWTCPKTERKFYAKRNRITERMKLLKMIKTGDFE